MENNKIDNIILSGGWGYGNLGDDAILEATVELLYERFPNAIIHILTYNINESKSVISNKSRCKFYRSLDLCLFGYNYHPTPIGKNKIVELKTAIRKRLYAKHKIHKEEKLISEILNNPGMFIENNMVELEEFMSLCNSANMYFMAGGGYINDWMQSVVSKYLEVKIAKDNNIYCYIGGITFGPFNGRIQLSKLAHNMLSLCNGVFFRDFDSIIEAGDSCDWTYKEIVPDVALSKKIIGRHMNTIVLIPFNRELEGNIYNICRNVVDIAKSKKLDVILTVSQLWYNPMEIVLKLYYVIRSMGCSVKVIIPDDYRHLQEILSHASIVISQNLHGLIMAYRSGTKIVCLNDKRKFVSFMKMIYGAEYLFTPQNIEQTTISTLLDSDYSIKGNIDKFTFEINKAWDYIFDSPKI